MIESNKKILGLGNALVDILVKLPNEEIINELGFPKGSMQLIDSEKSSLIANRLNQYSSEQSSGGSAANTIHGIAALKMATSFIGKVSNDAFGDFFANDLLKAHITPNLLKSETATGRAIAMITPDGERTFATYLGAAIEMVANDLSVEMFKEFDYVHIEGYLVQNHQLIEKAVSLAKQVGAKVSLDMASFNVVEENYEFLWDIVKNYVDIIFANEEEAKAFTHKDPEQAVEQIGNFVDIAVVKIGKKGALIKQGNRTETINAYGVDVIDTTGAGDLFASGFLYGLMNDWDIAKAGDAGSKLAGHIIGKIGARFNENEMINIRKELNI